jgi:acetyl-CoA acetyltransferase
MPAAIAGIGTVGFGPFPDESVASLASRAVSAALADCGLERRQLDGLLVHIGSPRGLDYDELALLLGLDVRFAAQTWSHGRFTATVLITAALALDAGLADYVLCVGAFKNTAFSRVGTTMSPSFFEGLREGGGPHAETPWVGLAAPAGGAALALRRYLHRYGLERERLGAIAVAQRREARANPLAAMRKPLTRAEYEASPFVVEPLRLLDCSYPVDTACAVILTRADRARELAQRPVGLFGFQGIHAGPNEFIFGQPGLGINQAEVFDYRPLGAEEAVYRAAGVAPADVGALHCYDGFSPQVLWTLERFGFCAPGEALGLVESGALLFNTSGGHLSEGHSNGWGHTLEIVRRLRRGGGVEMWATTLGDAVIYGA